MPYTPPATSETPPQPSQLPPNNPAIGFLRVVVWLSPAPAFVLCGLVLSSIGSSSFFAASGGIFWIPIAIICPAAIGYFDAFLSRKIPKQDGFPLPKPAIRHVIIFTLLQIILAPCILFAMLLGFCAYAGAF